MFPFVRQWLRLLPLGLCLLVLQACAAQLSLSRLPDGQALYPPISAPPRGERLESVDQAQLLLDWTVMQCVMGRTMCGPRDYVYEK